MSLRDPLAKMSKSDPQPQSRILLTDSPPEIAEKVKKAVTDSIDGISFDPQNRPGLSNLLQIYGYMQRRRDFDNIARELGGCGKKVFKERVADCVVEGLKHVRDEYARIVNEGDGYLEMVAEQGARRARDSAEETMLLVRKAMGLI